MGRAFLACGLTTFLLGGLLLLASSSMSRRPLAVVASQLQNAGQRTSPTQAATSLRSFSGTNNSTSTGRSPLTTATGIFGAANGLGLTISLATGSHLHLDLIGTGAFVAAAGATCGPDLRSTLSAAAVSLWATRLALFLFYRALSTGHDERLDDTLATTSGAVGFWTVSFVWGCLTALPHTLGAGGLVRPALGLGSAAAAVVYFTGLAFEVIADFQKWQFKQDPANKGKFCDVGLWSLSQHPNYFGNICLWSGIFFWNLPVLAAAATGGQGGALLALLRRRKVLAGALSPLLLTLLFYGQASGSVTNAKELAVQRYGADLKYQKYVQQVPLIVPRFFPSGPEE